MAGIFTGDVVAKWLHKHKQGADRDMELIQPFSYTDEAGFEWRVPAGAVIDGASIPSPFWTFGPPFVGDYRRASVVHDHFCVMQTRSWQDTHRMFREACRADGVGKIKAKTMYAAIRSFGPRWELALTDMVVILGNDNTSIASGMTVDLKANADPADFEQLAAWIEDTDPSLEEIDEAVEKIVVLTAMPPKDNI